MAKKTIAFLATATALFAFALVGLANAQTVPNGTAGVGYVQLDGLAVVSVSSGAAPATLTATLEPYPYNTATAPFVEDSAGTCYQYPSEFATNRNLVYCPTDGDTTTVTADGAVLPMETYTIKLSPSTEIVLNDGTPANPADLTPGDNVNVFGYYEGGMVIDATTVHDLSKPATWAYAYVYPNSGSAVVVPTTAGTDVTIDPSLTTIEAEIQAIANKIAALEAEVQSGNY